MSARFAPGERVRVQERYPPGHIRTPYYCRGHTGVVERLCGAFRNPDSRAYGGDGLPRQPLYRVRFRQRDLWPDYAGRDYDTVEIEIYQRWLDPAPRSADEPDQGSPGHGA